jgi:hypothetical protein
LKKLILRPYSTSIIKTLFYNFISMSNLSAEDFLNKKVKVIFEPIIASVILEKPKDPVKVF